MIQYRMSRSLLPAILSLMLGACAVDTVPTAAPVVKSPLERTSTDLGELYGVSLSLDSTATSEYAGYEGEMATCRNHYNAIDMYWMGPNGNVMFHLPAPLIFVGLRGGSYGGLLRAKYEVTSTRYATDRAGVQWAFNGQFNALCKWTRIGRFEMQTLVAQDPIHTPYQVSGGGGGGGGCGGGGGPGETFEPMSIIALDPEDVVTAAELEGYADEINCGGGSGSGSTGSGTSLHCWDEYITIEISCDGGLTWEDWWSGWATVCDLAVT